ncbi:MAG: hypothetical protein GWO30_06935, partial [Gammaproteobacteria bacterium]|nr:hypothetical protein [Gammaproteobacteria bacterium]NIR25728.1 hypothetical protein [Gammaproteobacteria bacterium]NIY20177.1 hypothetical protein [Gammaproteobacteria bacterium]
MSDFKLFETCSMETEISPTDERVELIDSWIIPAPPAISAVALVVEEV